MCKPRKQTLQPSVAVALGAQIFALCFSGCVSKTTSLLLEHHQRAEKANLAVCALIERIYGDQLRYLRRYAEDPRAGRQPGEDIVLFERPEILDAEISSFSGTSTLSKKIFSFQQGESVCAYRGEYPRVQVWKYQFDDGTAKTGVVYEDTVERDCFGKQAVYRLILDGTGFDTLRESRDDLVTESRSGEPEKFVVEYRGTIEWPREPSFPVYVQIWRDQVALYSMRVDSRSFDLCARLAPGIYDIRSKIPEDRTPQLYWDAYGPKLTVKRNGNVCFGDPTSEDPTIRHPLILSLHSPLHMEMVYTARPTLLWEAIPESKSYVLSWFEMDKDKMDYLSSAEDLPTSSTDFTFSEDLKPDLMYEWNVQALNENGIVIAKNTGYFVTAVKLDR